MNAPKEITAGFTVEWSEAPSGYPSSSYTLAATLIEKSTGTKSTITAVADGDGFAFTIPAATSAGYTSGDYRLYLYAVSGAEKYLIGQQDVTIKPNPLTATGDIRDHVKKMLDAINATLEGRASQEYASMSIDGKSITQMDPDTLLRLRAYYVNEYRKLQNADRIANGKQPLNKVFTKLS